MIYPFPIFDSIPRRPAFRHAPVVLLALLFITASCGIVWAAEVSVDCNSKHKKSNSIAETLAQLNKAEENIVHVSGTCNEYVLIDSFRRLSLLGDPGATINVPGAPDEDDALDIYNSGYITISGFTINGALGEGVVCAASKQCDFINNTIQGAIGHGVSFWGGSGGYLDAVTIQDNGFSGVVIGRGSRAQIRNTTIRNNAGGINVATGSGLYLEKPPTGEIVTIENNRINNSGLLVDQNSTAAISPGSTIINSVGQGVVVKNGSVLTIAGNITINAGTKGAVTIGDLSLVTFGADDILTGGTPVVNCAGKYSVATGLPSGVTTNCP
ncbi:MAG: right-handed parallel beta-helix repeat-containing protein [Acidobacteriia bacterium]|nr:right-handed parallel beta-helix repeat-containing protein [Terriglobia bacterium]